MSDGFQPPDCWAFNDDSNYWYRCEYLRRPVPGGCPCCDYDKVNVLTQIHLKGRPDGTAYYWVDATLEINKGLVSRAQGEFATFADALAEANRYQDEQANP